MAKITYQKDCHECEFVKRNDKYLYLNHEYIATSIEVICGLYVVTLLNWIPILYLSGIWQGLSQEQTIKYVCYK